MAIRIEGDEQDFVERNEDEGRTDGGSPSLLAQPPADPHEHRPRSPLATGNARPLPYLDEWGNDVEPGNVYMGPDNRLRYDTGSWSDFAQPKEPFTGRFNSPYDTLGNERFVVPATPEETAILRRDKERAIQYGTGAVIEDIFAGNRIAWEIAPDKMAHNLWLHRETDIPLSMMGDSDILHEAEIRAQMKADAQLLWDSPENVVQWFNHPQRLAMARDDMAVLTAIGKAFDRMAERIGRPTVEYQDRTWDITQGYRIGRAQTELGALYTKQMNQGLTPAEMRRVAELQNIVALNTTLNPGWWERMLTGAGRMTGQRQDQIMRGLKWGSIAALTMIAAVATGGTSLPGSGAAIGGTGLLGTGLSASTLVGSSFAGGMAYGAMESGFLSETGLAWEEFSNMRDENGNLMDPNTARWAATIYGSLASLIEMAQLDVIAKPFVTGWRTLAKQGTMQVLKNKTLTSALTEFAKSYLGDLGFEVGTEVLQQGAQIVAREGAKRYENAQYGRRYTGATGGEILNELGETAVDSFFEFALSMLPGPLFRIGADVRSARQAQRNLQIFQSINDETAASKLKGREPEMFRSFVSGVTRDGPVKEIGIPVERFIEYFQSLEINPATVAAELGIADQLSEAIETGSDLVIATDVFTEKLAGSEHFEGLKQDLRFGENTMTVREAREFDQNLVQEFDQALREASETETEYQANRKAAEAIREDLKAQIIALNHKALGSKQAEFTAALYTAWLTNEARLKGISPRELADRVNLRVEYDKKTGDPVIRRTIKNAAQEWFNQTMDRDVDLKARVPILNVLQETRNTITDQDRKDMSARFGDGIVNVDTGLRVTLSTGKKGAGHIAHSAFMQEGEAKQALIASFFNLPEIVRNARRVKTTGDRKVVDSRNAGRSGSVQTVRRFLFPVRYGDNLYILKLTAKELVPGHVEIDLSDPRNAEIKLYDQKIGKKISGVSSASGAESSGRPTVETAPDTDISIGEMAVNVKDTLDTEPYLSPEEYEEQTGKKYTFNQSAAQLPQTPEGLRQVAERMRNIPSTQWTREDYAQFEAYLDQFDPTDMDTWGLSPEERSKLQHLEYFDDYDYTTWPDAAKRERAEHLNAILRNTDEDPAPGTPEAAILDRMAELEALSDEESSKSTDAEYEKLEKQWDKIQKDAQKELDALEREMERLSEKKFTAREEFGDLLAARLQQQIENYPNYILDDFRHPANKDIASIQNMLREAEALPAEQWSPELRERMADFIASGREDSYWGRNPYDREQYLQATALDWNFPDTWANYEETADLGRRAMDLEERIAVTLDPQEKKTLRAELAALKKEVKPLLKEAEAWRQDVIDIDEARINAILEKAKSLGLEAEAEAYSQSMYHGSPWQFDRFLMSEIGRGEGTQAEGYGMYLTVDKNVANIYRMRNSGPRSFADFLQGVYERDESGNWIDSAGNPLGENMRFVLDKLEGYIVSQGAWDPEALRLNLDNAQREFSRLLIPEEMAEIQPAIERIRQDTKDVELPPVGQTYKVEGPEDAVLLNRDAPLSRQSPDVVSKLQENGLYSDPSITGAQLYSNLESEHGGAKQTSEYLDSIGIPGAYFNLAGRKAFVVWNPQELQILAKEYPQVRRELRRKERVFRQQQVQDANQRVARGYSRFLDGETVIGILKNGDRSTFLHEMAHLFLESRRQFSLEADVPETVRRDWAKITDWLGVSDIDFSKPLSEADRKRWTNAQEKWASGFEKYLMDGEAPTPELQRAFRNFKKWLTDIYKAVKNILYTDADGQQHEFEISDDIRGVMDRMLASEEEIEASRTLREARNIAESLKARGIPDDVSARYKDLIEKGADKAKAKLYRKLISELRDEKRAELNELKKEARRQAGREVWEQPEYKALKALRLPPEKGGLRLSMPDLAERMGTTEAEALVKELPFGVVANVGVDIDTAADLLGYPSGDALIEDLKKAKSTPPSKAIADRARAQTEQLESLIGNPEALRREIEEALHGSERLEWIALEEQLLREEAGKVGESIGQEQQKEQREQERREERETNEQARQEATRDWKQWADDMAARAAAYDETAKKILRGKTLPEATRTGFYMAAERRAADKAYRAAMEGKSWLAADWKQREMLNHALAAESLRIRQEIETGERLLKKYWPNRKKLRGVIGEEHFAQIMGLLERAGFNREDPRSAGRPRLTDWIRKIGAEKQIDLPIAQWIQDLDVRDSRTSPRSLSVEEFRDVVDAVKMIDHVGRQENRLLAEARNANFAETVDALEAATLKKHGTPKPQSIDPNQEGAGLFGRTLGTLDRAETLLRMADGFEDQGAWWDTFYRPTQRAFVAELEKSKKAKGDIEALFRKHFPDEKAFAKFLNEKFDTGLIDPATGKKLYWTGENLLAAMLNWGNEHNRERLVFGHGFDRSVFNNNIEAQGGGARSAAARSSLAPPNPLAGRYADDGAYFAAYENGRRTVEDIFNRLAKDEHWNFVQDVWDWLNTFWPEIEKLEHEMAGVAPEKVEASPVRTGSGKVLRGGYYPVRFDSNLDWRSLLNDEAETVKALYETQSRRASTRHGHTKERVERIIGRPLKLSLNVIQEHAGNVIHDLTHRPMIRDLTKLVQNDRVRELLTHAVGKEGFKQFNPWIQGMAAPTRPVDATDQFVSRMMGNASAVQLGLNLISMIGQTVGLIPASWKLGPAATAKAVLNTLSLRGIWDGKYKNFAFSLSPELKDRINGTDRNIRAALDMARADTKNRVWNEAKAALYLGLGWADMAIALPVWTAAYDQGLKQFNGDRQKAVDHADYVVRTSQNTGAAKDLAQIQRGSPFKKLFTMYYSAFGSLYQMFREEMVRAGKTGIPGKLRLAAFCFMMFAVQSALEDLIKGRSPWDEGEEPDDEEIAKWLLQGSFSTFASMFPGFRDIASASMGSYGGYRPSPALEGGSAIARAAKNVASDIWDLAWDTKDLEDLEVGKTLKSVFDAGGYAFGLPTTQLSRWGRTFMRWVNAETDFSPWELIWAKRGKK